MRIDLHTHSTASDGTDTPAELVANAAAAGLDAVAITDHDTTAGWDEAAAALPPGLRLVRGAELSCVSRRRPRRALHRAPAGLPVRPGRRRRRRRAVRRAARRAPGPARDDRRPDGRRRVPDRRRTHCWPRLPADATAGRPHLAMALVARRGRVRRSTRRSRSSSTTAGATTCRARDTPVDGLDRDDRRAGGVTVLAHAFAHAPRPDGHRRGDQGPGRRSGWPASRSTTPTTTPTRAGRLRGAGRRPGPDRHRIERLPRHQQGDPARPGDHRAGDARRRSRRRGDAVSGSLAG